MITITRDSGYADRLRAYKIILDGENVGSISNGEKVDLNVPAGEHELYLKIDWARSNKLNFRFDDKQIDFIVSSPMRGGRVVMAFIYTFFLFNKYIKLDIK